MAVRHVGGITAQAGREFVRKVGGALAHLAGSAAGIVVGLAAGVYWLARTGSNPARDDAAGRAIRQQLQGNDAQRQTAGV